MNNTKKWDADIAIQNAQVKECLTYQFPELLPLKSIQFIGEGWDNRVFLVNETIIFRFPRRKVAVELIEHENRVLPQLQSRLSLQIPHPIYQGKPCKPYPYPFQGYLQLKGCTAEGISQEQRINNLESLALFLKQLHSIDKTQAMELGAKPQLFDKTQLSQAITTFKDRIEQLAKLNFFSINFSEINKEVSVIQNIKLNEQLTLVHGDLHVKHLLFSQGKLTGVIDWGDVSINHPVVDLSLIWGFLPEKYHFIFQNIYGVVQSDTWKYARFLALYVAFTFLLYGHDVDDKPLVNDALQSINNINLKLLKC